MGEVEILEKHSHLKASERYVHAIFTYKSGICYDVWVPIEYRRTGLDLKTEEEIQFYLNNVYTQMDPDNREKWVKDQDKFWSTKQKSRVTKVFFDALAKEVKWCCVGCDLPNNPNWARRIQDLKEMGYTLATNTNKFCQKCGENKTHIILLPIPRVENSGNGYETFSPKLRDRIISTLHKYDAYEGKKVDRHLLPDHKFSEIRWDSETKVKNPDTMTEDEIKDKFQLLTNQRNQQKREVCRTCYQTDKRGTIFGIKYFYKGNENWDPTIPKKGKAAEKGCYGCPWYDIEEWRQQLIQLIKKSK